MEISLSEDTDGRQVSSAIADQGRHFGTESGQHVAELCRALGFVTSTEGTFVVQESMKGDRGEGYMEKKGRKL
jgi:hypothetical protein